MKIVKVDNFDRESISDILVTENVSQYYGEHIVKMLNDKFSGDNAPDWFRLVEDDYKLYDAYKVYK